MPVEPESLKPGPKEQSRKKGAEKKNGGVQESEENICLRKSSGLGQNAPQKGKTLKKKKNQSKTGKFSARRTSRRKKSPGVNNRSFGKKAEQKGGKKGGKRGVGEEGRMKVSRTKGEKLTKPDGCWGAAQWRSHGS